ncbi:flavodoxin [Lachnospiraceae bacterium 45-W7]
MKGEVALKKTIYILSALFLMVYLTACGKADTEQKEENANARLETTELAENTEPDILESSSEEQISTATGHGKVLVAYFTWADNAEQNDMDAMTSASVKKPGNVAMLASWIAEETQGELFSIQAAQAYPADWDGCLDRANQEKADGIYPELTQTVSDMEEYDTVFLGYPNWWYSCPMAVLSFIEENDLSDKQVYLFCSHGTGGLARSVQDISEVLPESAKVSENVFDVYEDDTASAKEDLLSWLGELQ